MSAFRTKQATTTMENPVESLMVQTKSNKSDEVMEMRVPQEKKQAVVDPSTRRNCDSAQVYFLDYYFDLLTYLHERKERTKSFKEGMRLRQLNDDQISEEWKQYCGKERAYLRKRRTRTRVNQFQVLAQVGQGGYGAVYLARKKDTKEICALKKMSKKLLMKQGEVQHILTERDILTATKSPWLVKLLYAFQDPLHVYLAMEYVPGGDVRTLLNNSGVLRECHARFYAAEMILAVNALHGLGYIHRDLKPENFLIDAQGHIRLTDFGLSKGSLSPQRIESMKSKLEMAKNQKPIYRSTAERKTIHKSIRKEDITFAYSLVGSPDYMAPEILQAKGYDYLVDYWSLGTIFFEFLCGYPPFAAPTMEEVWVNVYHWEKVLERPVYTEEADLEFNLSNEAWNVIIGLVAVPNKRLSSLRNIQSLEFFRGFDWENVRESKTPPFKPNLRSEEDTSYFDDFSNPEDMVIYKEVYGKQKQLQESLGEESVDKKKNSGTSTGGGGVLPRTTFVGFTFRRKAEEEE